MKGADKYCRLFRKAEQIGRLYFLPHYHARGETFHIYVLPEGEKVIENGGINAPLNKGAVEVYGIVAGNPGWTEKYGWLHDGAWQDDFMTICEEKKQELQLQEERRRNASEKKNKDKEKRIADLLNTYR